MDELTQYEIAEGLKCGSPQAWLSLHEAYARRLWREVARLTGVDSARVADIVQDTFLAAAQSAPGFDPRRGVLWAWLWGIARRQIALHCRKGGSSQDLQRAKRWWASLDGRRRDMLTGVGDAPPEQIASRELATLVRSALSALPADYQMLLAAKYMEGASTKQIACDAAMTPSAVDSKLARARRAFRRAFARVTRPSRRNV
jgi:RNA polymerase sigma-70 factor (ECF subfamily)